MCGIAGIVGLQEGERPGAQISAMLGALARRGPDDEGVHTWARATLAHRRLAIIDLSPGGHQPMLSDDSEIGLVFNGCIYNFAELRRELEAHGEIFRSRCDTEVLLRGYSVWGTHELVRRLRGMFAFGIWDNRRKKLTLARDPLGVKPLCYATRGSRLAFASTPAALRAGGFAADIDPAAVLEYLEFGFVTDDRCIYADVHKLPAATVVEWQDGRLHSFTYWHAPSETRAVTFEDAVAETETRILDAVRIRLCADVPVSALLSGGIDSTLVCWALSKLGANIRAFTVSLPGEPEDEALQAEAAARVIGIPHEKIALPDLGDDMVDLVVSAYSEPFSAYSALAMLQLSKAIKPFATVMLTGDGGDEAFLGYPAHRNALLAQRLANRIPSFTPLLWKMFRPALNGFGSLRRAKHFLDYATGGLGSLTRVHDGLPYYDEHRLLGPRLTSRTIRQREIAPSIQSARRLLTDLLEYNRNTEFVGEFLTKVDGATMYYGIEARSPFLDREIWEFAGSLDYSLRLQNGRLKSIPREIVSRRVGPEVANRSKQGFHLPIDKWLVSRWRSRFEELANGSLLTQNGWIQKDALARLVTGAIEKGRANIHLWRMTLLNTWLEKEENSYEVSLTSPEEVASETRP